MSGETPLTVVGNLTDVPELRYTQSGVPVANFTVASTPRHFDKASGEWVDGATLFQRCTLWREPAENAAVSLSRGDRVVVVGQLTQESYEVKSADPKAAPEKRTANVLVVDDIGPALRYARATVMRVARSAAPAATWDAMSAASAESAVLSK